MDSTSNKRLGRLLDRLDGVRETGANQWEALCPAHDDRRASLAVSLGEKGIVIHCHAGCPTEDVVAALGMKMADLFLDTPSRNGSSRVSNGKIVAQYDYCDADGKQLFQVVRFEPKGFGQRRRMKTGKWEWSVKGCKRVPYRLPELLAAQPKAIVFVVEGEKDVDRLRKLGLVVTCNAGGARKWTREHAKYLAGRIVVIIPDNDDAGRKHVQDVARSLVGIAATVKVIDLPDLPDKGDVSDWLDAGGNKRKLLRLVESAAEWEPTAEDNDAGAVSEPTQSKNLATTIVELAENVDLFRDPHGEAYARFPVDTHHEVAAVRSRSFGRWLSRIFFNADGRAPAAQSVQDALSVMEGKALYDGETRSTHVRIAECSKKIYLDLGDPSWHVVEVDSEGWRIVDEPPVMFRRPKGLLPLPEPVLGGSVSELRPFINVSDDDWPLVLAWLVAALRFKGPYPVLAIHGLKGSAKSTTCKVLRKLIDPKTPLVSSLPRSEHDLIIAADNTLVLALDNLSHLSQWQSDCLCRLSTGSGFSTRALYHNAEETIFDASRPLMLNGIAEPITRSDLLDRCILLKVPSIDENSRRTEDELWREFEEARPRILGALLSAVAVALKNISSVKLTKPPRMADFAYWVVAAQPGLGLPKGTFMKAYRENLETHHSLAVEASAVGSALRQFVQTKGRWYGTATQLFQNLKNSDLLTRWQGNPRTLSSEIRNLEQNLRALGVYITFERTGQGRDRMIGLSWKVKQTANRASAPSASKVSKKEQPKSKAVKVKKPIPSFSQRKAEKGGRSGRKKS